MLEAGQFPTGKVYVTLCDENGNEVEAEVVRVFSIAENGPMYAAIADPTAEGEGSVALFRIGVDPRTGDEILEAIEDEAEFRAAGQAFEVQVEAAVANEATPERASH